MPSLTAAAYAISVMRARRKRRNRIYELTEGQPELRKLLVDEGIL